MAQPIHMFQGPAPAAMAMMGHGLSEAGANIGRFEQQGRQALGEGLASGITGAVKQMQGMQSAKAANSVTKSILGDEGMFKTFFPGGSEEQRKTMLSSFNQTIARDGQMGGMQFSSQIMGPFIEQQRLGQQFQQQLSLAQAKMKQTPDYGPTVSALDKIAGSVENFSAPLPAAPDSSGVGSIPLIDQQSKTNMADMLGGFLKQKYGNPVARPTNQDMLEFEKYLQSGGR